MKARRGWCLSFFVDVRPFVDTREVSLPFHSVLFTKFFISKSDMVCVAIVL
jgi:hypothetical protein